jgi:hypothetical protein
MVPAIGRYLLRLRLGSIHCGHDGRRHFRRAAAFRFRVFFVETLHAHVIEATRQGGSRSPAPSGAFACAAGERIAALPPHLQ